jgi:hypothetical protein
MRIIVSSTLLFASFLFIVTPVFAQNYASGSYKIQKGHLDDASKIHPSRPQVEILDETPIVKDRRQRNAQPVYEIAIPPLPNQSGANAGATAAPNGVIRLTPSRDGRILAAPGFQSNIPAAGVATARNLPLGTSTGVHAKAVTSSRSVQGQLPVQPGSLLGRKSTPATTEIAKYSNIPAAQGTTTVRTSESVKGVLKNRGQLLGR